MADELDDRLHDLAHDAEQLVVLAGPRAARARGERRRARRRAAAAGTAAALALGVTGWQLLPRLEHADGTRTAPPAASARPTPDATADRLTESLTARLLPPTSLPFAAKWQWRTVEGAEAGKLPSSCGVVPAPTGVVAEAATQYAAERIAATAYEQLLAYPDEHTAVVAADGLRARFGAKCGMAVTEVRGSVWGRLIAQRFMGSSKQISGVTVWIQHEGQYVAVLVVDSPKSPLWWQPGDEPDGPRPSGCLADSLDDLAMTTASHLPPAKAGTPYMTTSGGATGKKDAPTSTDDC